MVAMALLVSRSAAGPHVCDHLAPVERELAARGVPVGPGRPCPHEPEWGTWFVVDALFGTCLGLRLNLEPCVIFEEYEGVLSASDAMFYCTACQQAIVGRHAGSAPGGTPQIT